VNTRKSKYDSPIPRQPRLKVGVDEGWESCSEKSAHSPAAPLHNSSSVLISSSANTRASRLDNETSCAYLPSQLCDLTISGMGLLHRHGSQACRTLFAGRSDDILQPPAGQNGGTSAGFHNGGAVFMMKYFLGKAIKTEEAVDRNR